MDALVGKLVQDASGGAMCSMIAIGDKLGLYTALAEGGPMTAAELAKKTDTCERNIVEWCKANACGGYVTYDGATERFSLTDAQKMLLADPSSPVIGAAFALLVSAVAQSQDGIVDAFKSGKGLPWGAHRPELFEGTARLFKGTYQSQLVKWVNAIPGLQERLDNGLRVADVGCGFGYSTMILAAAFPKSTFVGSDIHPPSIEFARKEAEGRGLKNVTFEPLAAKEVGKGGQFDVVLACDNLHDQGDPVGCAKAVKACLNADGMFIVVEPASQPKLEDNFNLQGQFFFSASAQVCVLASQSQEVGAALGACSGEAGMNKVLGADGAAFTTVETVVKAPFNFVYVARM